MARGGEGEIEANGGGLLEDGEELGRMPGFAEFGGVNSVWRGKEEEWAMAVNRQCAEATAGREVTIGGGGGEGVGGCRLEFPRGAGWISG